MRVIRVHRWVESDTLQLPELREFIGKEVEILVLEEPLSRRNKQQEGGTILPLPGLRAKT